MGQCTTAPPDHQTKTEKKQANTAPSDSDPNSKDTAKGDIPNKVETIKIKTDGKSIDKDKNQLTIQTKTEEVVADTGASAVIDANNEIEIKTDENVISNSKEITENKSQNQKETDENNTPIVLPHELSLNKENKSSYIDENAEKPANNIENTTTDLISTPVKEVVMGNMNDTNVVKDEKCVAKTADQINEITEECADEIVKESIENAISNIQTKTDETVTDTSGNDVHNVTQETITDTQHDEKQQNDIEQNEQVINDEQQIETSGKNTSVINSDENMKNDNKNQAIATEKNESTIDAKINDKNEQNEKTAKIEQDSENVSKEQAENPVMHSIQDDMKKQQQIEWKRQSQLIAKKISKQLNSAISTAFLDYVSNEFESLEQLKDDLEDVNDVSDSSIIDAIKQRVKDNNENIDDEKLFIVIQEIIGKVNYHELKSDILPAPILRIISDFLNVIHLLEKENIVIKLHYNNGNDSFGNYWEESISFNCKTNDALDECDEIQRIGIVSHYNLNRMAVDNEWTEQQKPFIFELSNELIPKSLHKYLNCNVHERTQKYIEGIRHKKSKDFIECIKIVCKGRKSGMMDVVDAFRRDIFVPCDKMLEIFCVDDKENDMEFTIHESYDESEPHLHENARLTVINGEDNDPLGIND